MRRPRHRRPGAPARQGGQAIIALLLVFVTGMSFMLLKDINANLRQADRALETARALAEAKRAILGYAAAYPDGEHNTQRGPGRLPCPDRWTTDANADGIADNAGIEGSNCSATFIGRLPWKTLDMDRGVDATGQTLWYAFSPNFGKTQPVVNSETAGTLTVNGVPEVVAVLIAPGEPLEGQDGRTPVPGAAGYLDVDQYLDGENADGDDTYTVEGGAPFNDRVVFITRDEVMDLAERRVAGEAHRVLREYQAAFNAYPWLAGWAPGGAQFLSLLPLTNEGHLPFHVLNESFQTTFRMNWQGPSSGTYPVSGTVQPIDFRQQTVPLDFAGGTCTWRGVRAVQACTGQATQVLTVPDRTRTFSVTVTFTGASHTVTPPTATTLRTRSVSSTGTLPSGSSVTVAIQDVDTDGNITGDASMTFSAGMTLSITVADIAYDLNPADDGAGDGPSEIVEIPAWFVTDQWHRMTLVSYADAEPLPGGAAACTPGTDCLAVCTDGLDCPPGAPAQQDVRALVVVGGQARAGQTRPGSQLTDYFENENANPARAAFERASATANDRVRVVATAP